MQSNSTISIFLKDTDPEEILQIISSLKPKKAVGYDGIYSKILQTLGYVFSSMLSNIFNKSMQLGIFPDKLKIAKVIPLHKGGKTDVINIYRPISILSSLSKIYEKIINGSFVESPHQKNTPATMEYLKRGGSVFLKSHIFALVAGAFYKRS